MTARDVDTSPRSEAEIRAHLTECRDCRAGDNCPAGTEPGTTIAGSERLVGWSLPNANGRRVAVLGVTELPRMVVWPTALQPSGFALWTVVVETISTTMKHSQNNDPTDAECLAWLAYVLEQDTNARRRAREIFGPVLASDRGVR